MDKDRIYSMFINCEELKPEISNNMDPKKAPNVLNAKDILINSSHTKEESQREM